MLIKQDKKVPTVLSLPFVAAQLNNSQWHLQILTQLWQNILCRGCLFVNVCSSPQVVSWRKSLLLFSSLPNVCPCNKIRDAVTSVAPSLSGVRPQVSHTDQSWPVHPQLSSSTCPNPIHTFCKAFHLSSSTQRVFFALVECLWLENIYKPFKLHYAQVWTLNLQTYRVFFLTGTPLKS